MILIINLDARISKKGKLEKWGLFLCLYCLQKVERRLDGGLKQKSCGCAKNVLIGKSNKGKKRTKEQNIKNSEIQKGRIVTKETRQKISKALKGKKRTEEQRKNISESQKGKKYTKEHRQKLSELNKGKNNPMHGVHRYGKDSPAYGLHRYKELAPNWQGGISFEPYSPEFNKELKQQVLERDNYTCQNPHCWHKSKKLDIHHIDYDKKNNNTENLITLCGSCHTKTNGKNNRKYFTEFYQNIIMGRINEIP